MNNKKLVFVILLIFLVNIFIGCIQDTSSKTFEEKILGEWYREDITNDITYKFVYRFYSNNSFYSGVWREDTNNFISGIWGIYSISDDKLTFITTGQVESTSTHKISFNEDGNSFLLYLEDESDFDVLYRENS